MGAFKKRRRSSANLNKKPESGEYPRTPVRSYLVDCGWIPFLYKEELRWIDPDRPYDQSLDEENAFKTQRSRDIESHKKPSTEYSFIYNK